ncbi:hypothetical protein NEOLI_002600 [Neolecta irregularis DAH-3]|uniref:Transcription factor domain-containing protein n=1 Tax=Neolecta irregularis (strain DAH-3) TaxID=1198029 RepID=A0A1U7LVI2_NEOID|nr:hypothetical protein NEOLI_002600 [Neolecta irregularis DAH-3]|eukprot:OLL26667.1 hypothetical protein NEOLI_002600 [Neolecta irregularis DAH-3]
MTRLQKLPRPLPEPPKTPNGDTKERDAGADDDCRSACSRLALSPGEKRHLTRTKKRTALQAQITQIEGIMIDILDQRAYSSDLEVRDQLVDMIHTSFSRKFTARGYLNSTGRTSRQKTFDISTLLAYLPHEIHALPQIAEKPFEYELDAMQTPEYQSLFHKYLAVSARCLSSSPTHCDIWSTVIPQMARETSSALLEIVVAIGALQVARMDGSSIAIALYHYQKALSLARKDVTSPQTALTDHTFALIYLLGWFDLFRGDNASMGLHMIGCRNIISNRGKTISDEPLGRCLFSHFTRVEIATSMVTGNSSFMNPEWYNLDPFVNARLDENSIYTYAADVAYSRLCIIQSKLTELKAWKVNYKKNGGDTTAGQVELMSRITLAEKELFDWKASLPSWFGPLPDEPGTLGFDPTASDINCIRPSRYPSEGIAIVYANFLATYLQLHHLFHVDVFNPGSSLAAAALEILRIFAFVPPESIVFMVVPVSSAGMSLSHPHQRNWTLNQLYQNPTKLDAAELIRAALAHIYKVRDIDGRFQIVVDDDLSNRDEFERVPEGVEREIEGVSENLYKAEGLIRLAEV